MYNRMLKQMQDKIQRRDYVMTLHAEEEMIEDGFSVYDIERVILTGSILESQKDKVTLERKYRISGKTIENYKAEVIAKLSPTGKLVIITAYAI